MDDTAPIDMEFARMPHVANLIESAWLYLNSLDHDMQDSAIKISDEEYEILVPHESRVLYEGICQTAQEQAAHELFEKIIEGRESEDLRRSEMEQLSSGVGKLRVAWCEWQY